MISRCHQTMRAQDGRGLVGWDGGRDQTLLEQLGRSSRPKPFTARPFVVLSLSLAVGFVYYSCWDRQDSLPFALSRVHFLLLLLLRLLFFVCVSLFCVHLHHFPAVCVINNWHIVRTSCACIASCHHHFINARFSEFVNNTVTVGHRAPHACQPDIMNRTTFWACADQHSMARHLFRGFPL